MIALFDFHFENPKIKLKHKASLFLSVKEQLPTFSKLFDFHGIFHITKNKIARQQK